MGNKTYLRTILQELEKDVEQAKGLLMFLDIGMISQENIDAIISILKETLKITQNNKKIQRIEKNIKILEKIKDKEKIETKKEKDSLDKLISNL